MTLFPTFHWHSLSLSLFLIPSLCLLLSLQTANICVEFRANVHAKFIAKWILYRSEFYELFLCYAEVSNSPKTFELISKIDYVKHIFECTNRHKCFHICILTFLWVFFNNLTDVECQNVRFLERYDHFFLHTGQVSTWFQNTDCHGYVICCRIKLYLLSLEMTKGNGKWWIPQPEACFFHLLFFMR